MCLNVPASGNQTSHTVIGTSAKSGVSSSGSGHGIKSQALLNTAEEIPYELKLNITDSEIVFVEDTSQWDTNAVILKVTRVLLYDKGQADFNCFLTHTLYLFINHPIIWHDVV